MIIDESIKSILKLDNLYYEELFFKRSSEAVSSNKIKINAQFEVVELSDEDYQVKLKVQLNDSDNALDIKVVLVGDFSISEEFPKEQREILIQKNTVSIMFPYVRSQVTLLTSQPGMEPIIIPPINVNALVNNAEKSK